MFDDILHVGYLVRDLDRAVAWFAKVFGAENAGGGQMADTRVVPGGGRNAFVRFGGTEVELMQPTDIGPLPPDKLVLHHVGYVVADMDAAMAKARAKGLGFLAEAPFTNPMGQQVLYFDPDTTNGVLIHLTKVPAGEPASRGDGPRIDDIVHPGYLVGDLDAATAWYVDKLGGELIGGGPSRQGGRIAFVNCGAAQVELIEPPEGARPQGGHVLDHIGYVTQDIDADMPGYRARGLSFMTEAATINPVGQRLIYFDPASTWGTRIHITELPA